MALLVGAVAMTASNVWTFFSASSLLIVLGGTIAAAYISYEARYVALGFREMSAWSSARRPAATTCPP